MNASEFYRTFILNSGKWQSRFKCMKVNGKFYVDLDDANNMRSALRHYKKKTGKTFFTKTINNKVCVWRIS